MQLGDVMKDFFQLFVHELKDAYDCETQILKALPEMISAASCSQLKEVLTNHVQETKKQIKRLEEISQEINENLKGAECDAIRGILKEGQKTINMHFQTSVQDAAIIGACQRVEHYEIALYGILKTHARHLNLKNVEDLLSKTLLEEGNVNKKLTEIAEGRVGVNNKACNEQKSA